MQLVRKIPWTKQPQQPLTFDASNPLTKGLSLILLPVAGGLNPVDSVRALAFTSQGGTTISGTYAGTGWSVNTGTTDGIQSPTPVTTTYPFTLGSVFVPGTLVASTHLFGVANSAAANNRNRIGLQIGSGAATVEAFAAGTSNIAVAPSIQSPVVGAVNTAVGIFVSSSSRRVTLNGVAGTANTTTIGTTGLSNTAVGSAPGSTRQTGAVGVHLLAVAWSRDLSDVEAISFSQNPWQIFAPTTQKMYFFPILSLPTFTPGSMTSTGFKSRVTAT